VLEQLLREAVGALSIPGGLPRATSSLASNASRDGASTTMGRERVLEVIF